MNQLPKEYVVQVTLYSRQAKEVALSQDPTYNGSASYYYFDENKQRNDCDSENIWEDVPVLTYNQWKKLKDGKIIGYKCPIDLYNGSIKKGTIYGGKGNHNYNSISGIYGCDLNPNHNMPKEIVETWEPVYEETMLETAFKVGFPLKDVFINNEKRLVIDNEEVNINNVIRLRTLFEPVDGHINWSIQAKTVWVGCPESGSLITLEDVDKVITEYNKLNR